MSTRIDHHIRVEINFDQHPSREFFMPGYYRAELDYGADYKQAWMFVMLRDEDREVMPGETVQAYLGFLSPQYQLSKIAVGTQFWLRSAQRLDGTGHVTDILNLERAVREGANYDVAVEVTFLHMPTNNPTQVYSLFYGKHLDNYDLYHGFIKLPFEQTTTKPKQKPIAVQFELQFNPIDQAITEFQHKLNEQHQWIITKHRISNAIFLQANNAIVAKGQGIQLLADQKISIIGQVTLSANDRTNFQKADYPEYGFIYGTLFHGENYDLNGTERLLIIEEGQTVTLGQPVRGHLDLHGIAEHIKALPKGTKFVLRVNDQTIAKGRVI